MPATDTIWNVLHGLGLTSLLRVSKKGMLTILSLHRVSPEKDYFWQPLHPEKFEELLRYVKANYEVIYFGYLKQLPSSKQKPYLILSFDDGYYDFYEHALPLLVKYKLPSNHNIVNECASRNQVIWTQRLNHIFNHCRNHHLPIEFELGRDMVKTGPNEGNFMKFYLQVFQAMLQMPAEQRVKIIEEKEKMYSTTAQVKMMNWEQVRESANNGVEIGSHTYSHDVISTIQKNDLLQKEIVQSVRELEMEINRPVKVLALPNGRGNAFVDTFAAEAGIEHLLYVGDRLNQLPLQDTPGLKKYERINIAEENRAAMFLRIEGFHEKLKKVWMPTAQKK